MGLREEGMNGGPGWGDEGGRETPTVLRRGSGERRRRWEGGSAMDPARVQKRSSSTRDISPVEVVWWLKEGTKVNTESGLRGRNGERAHT